MVLGGAGCADTAALPEGVIVGTGVLMVPRL